MTSIFKRAAVVLVGFTMLMFGFAGMAEAQSTYSPVYPEVGPISAVSGQLSGEPGNTTLTDNAAAFRIPVVAASAGAGGGTGGAGEIAFTGAESGVLAAAGLGLVLVGGAAVVISRKR